MKNYVLVVSDNPKFCTGCIFDKQEKCTHPDKSSKEFQDHCVEVLEDVNHIFSYNLKHILSKL